MKKALSAVILAAMMLAMLSLCGCAGASEYSVGTLTEASWESRYLGLRFDCPDGYGMSSRENLDMLSSAINASGSDASGGDIDYAKAPTVYEMQATSRSGLPGVTVSVEKLSSDHTLEQYTDALISQLSSLNVSGLEYSFGESETVTFAGEKYIRRHASVTTGEMTVDQDYYLRKIDDRVLCLIFSYCEQYGASADELIDAFRKY